MKWRHQQSRFEQVECRDGVLMLLALSFVLSLLFPRLVDWCRCSTLGVKQVLASIESQEVFNSKESLGTLGICRVCIISSIGERQVRMKWTLGPVDALSGLVLF